MVQVLNVAMWMVHSQVLVKKDRVEDGHVFNADQDAIVSIGFGFGTGGLMTP